MIGWYIHYLRRLKIFKMKCNKVTKCLQDKCDQVKSNMNINYKIKCDQVKSDMNKSYKDNNNR